MTITTRSGKGSALTHPEMDANLNTFNNWTTGPATKTEAKALTPEDGVKIYPQGLDGGVFIGGTGKAAGYYNDDGVDVPNGIDAYGTRFKPTGSDGSAGWERDYNGAPYVTWFKADPTGVALSNASFTLANAVSYVLRLGRGTFRLENYTAAEMTIIGEDFRTSIITGDGDLLVGVNNLTLKRLRLLNVTTEGKLISHDGVASRLGDFSDVSFVKATHHIYSPSGTIVGLKLDNCNLSRASVYSREFLGAIITYHESHCYTAFNKRALYLDNASNVSLTGGAVFEQMEEGAIYFGTKAGLATYALNISDTRFEVNGTVTPSADITLSMLNGSGMTLDLSNVLFAGSTVNPNVVTNVTGSAICQIRQTLCTGLKIDPEDATFIYYDDQPPKIVNAEKGRLVSDIYNIVTPSNIKGLWVMDRNDAVSTIIDRSGNDHTLTLRDSAGSAKNASTLGPSVDGYAPSLLFSSDNNFDTPDHADFTFGNGTTDSAFSIVWLGKMSSSISQQYLFAKLDVTTGTTLREYFLRYDGTTSGQLLITCYDESANAYIQRFKAGALTDATKFHSIIGTKSTGITPTDMKIYLDGAQVDDTSDSGGTYVAMEDTTALPASYAISTAGAIEKAPDAKVSVVMVVGEELTTDQIRQLDYLLRSYAGDTLN